MKFESNFNIGETVKVNRYVDITDNVNNQILAKGEGWRGLVVKVSFTKSKVYYDILADEDSVIYQGIVSERVSKIKTVKEVKSK